MKAIGIIQAFENHYIDHIAPICELLQIPMMFLNARDHAIATQYYPQLKSLFPTDFIFDWDYIFPRYDVLFVSGLINRQQFRNHLKTYENKYGKVLRYVHCPHGFSDKIAYMSQMAREDITLIYGQNNLDLCQLMQTDQFFYSYVISGNYRYLYYLANKKFCDQIFKEQFLSRFELQQPVILYAPTWVDYDNISTFFDTTDEVLSSLPDDYNMLVKVHPRLKRDKPFRYNAIYSDFHGKKNIVFVEDFPLIYPLLSAAAIYLGDGSSIGYDFLIFNRPMFFLNKQKRDVQLDRRLYLNRCGITIDPEDFPRIYEIIEHNTVLDQNQFAQIRQKVYDYTFATDCTLGQLKNEIIEACCSSKPWKSDNFLPL